jgi:hypothetical protein
MSAENSKANDGRNESDDKSTADAIRVVETVHTVGDWRLSVRGDGSVEAHKYDATDIAPYTTRDEWFGLEGEWYRCGKTIENVLARYCHETRFERDPNDENGAALRNGIISALQSVATDATCETCDGVATHICHVNSPTGPYTSLTCDRCVDPDSGRTYATYHKLDNATAERNV